MPRQILNKRILLAQEREREGNVFHHDARAAFDAGKRIQTAGPQRETENLNLLKQSERVTNDIARIKLDLRSVRQLEQIARLDIQRTYMGELNRP